ncbi:MAG: type I-E CRISPR-associated protein Cas7/Cse4/CasC [Clostridiales bacterium]|jgi:CRISPR system Cascade subunit CasC|nr:type I-E CRISPR-associated protein Cas7/Cse4/CasC [Clostridiales bacterium]
MNKPKIFVDLHVLQTVPPNCLNRDDMGSPKTAIYGGARRARVSSQSWKRAMRLMFREIFDEGELGTRTLHLFDVIANEIIKKSPETAREEAMEMAKKVLQDAKAVKPSKKDEDKVEALFFISAQQAKNLATAALGEIEVKDILSLLKEGNSVDLALFGRMVASNAEINCDASAQVAHAISTHAVENEYDFFTAVDDLSESMTDHAGAGMMGTVEYNSATLYRYATVAAHNLFEQLANNKEALEKAIAGFTKAFICSMPTGKQNTFAAQTLPYAVLVTLRADRPLNLAGAFENPIKGQGLAISSAKALEDYAKSSYDDFCAHPLKSYVVGQYLGGLGDKMNLDNMLAKLSADISEEVCR